MAVVPAETGGNHGRWSRAPRSKPDKPVRFFAAGALVDYRPVTVVWWNRLWFDCDRLWRLIKRTALAGLPAAAGGLWACGPCPPEDRIFLLRSPEPDIQALIDQCRRPAAPQCEPLCVRMLSIESGPFARTTFDHCELHADRDGYVRVHVGWLRDTCGH